MVGDAGHRPVIAGRFAGITGVCRALCNAAASQAPSDTAVATADRSCSSPNSRPSISTATMARTPFCLPCRARRRSQSTSWQAGQRPAWRHCSSGLDPASAPWLVTQHVEVVLRIQRLLAAAVAALVAGNLPPALPELDMQRMHPRLHPAVQGRPGPGYQRHCSRPGNIAGPFCCRPSEDGAGHDGNREEEDPRLIRGLFQAKGWREGRGLFQAGAWNLTGSAWGLFQVRPLAECPLRHWRLGGVKN